MQELSSMSWEKLDWVTFEWECNFQKWQHTIFNEHYECAKDPDECNPSGEFEEWYSHLMLGEWLLNRLRKLRRQRLRYDPEAIPLN